MTHHLMNLMLRLLGLLCLFCWGGLLVQAMFIHAPGILLPLPGNWEPELPVWAYMVLSSVLLAIAMGLSGAAKINAVTHQHRQSHRQLEKTSMNAEWNADHVRALEAKIQTLETALASAVGAPVTRG